MARFIELGWVYVPERKARYLESRVSRCTFVSLLRDILCCVPDYFHSVAGHTILLKSLVAGKHRMLYILSMSTGVIIPLNFFDVMSK